MNPKWPRQGTGDDDPTVPLPAVDRDPTNVIDITSRVPVPADVEGTGTPPAVDALVRHALVASDATRGALARWLLTWPDPEQLDELVDAHEAGDPDAEDAWRTERSRQQWIRIRRWAIALAAAAVILNRFWVLLGNHGMWALIIGIPFLLAAFVAAGWALGATRRLAAWIHSRRAPAPEDDTPDPWRGALALDAGDTAARTTEDEEGDEDADLAVAVDPDPATIGRRGAPDRPGWLTRVEIERRLRRADRQLRNAEALRVEDDGTAVLIDLLGYEWTGNGWQVTVELPADYTSSQLMSDTARERIARQWKVEVVQILLEPGRHPGILVMWICDRDPLVVITRRSHLAELTRWNVHRPWTIGQDLYGRPVNYLAPGHHDITVGTTRSGKSVAEKLKAAHGALDEHVQEVFVDPNGGEWAGFRHVALYFGGAEGLVAGLKYFRWLADVDIEWRARRLALLKERYPADIPEMKVPEWLARDPEVGRGLHRVFFWIEEGSRVFNLPDGVGQEWYRSMERLYGEGAKYGIKGHAVFQRASNRAFGGAGVELRENVNTQLCGAVASEGAVKMVLGDDYRKEGPDPQVLEPGLHGGTFVGSGGSLILPAGVRGNTFIQTRFTDDDELAPVLGRALRRRQELRPDLLPPHTQSRPEATQKQLTLPDDADTEPTAAEPLDLEPLRRIVAVLEEAGEGLPLATDIVEQLNDRWPGAQWPTGAGEDGQGSLTKTLELHAVLRRYGLGTVQPKQPDGTKHRRVRLAACTRRLRELEADQ